MIRPDVFGALARDPRGSYWRGLSWSEWATFGDSRPTRGQGIYRVRSDSKGLAYIGMSGNLAFANWHPKTLG